MSPTPWRSDPDLAGRFHPDNPDDIQVVVHDGEPRRSQRAPEGCWVRVEAVHSTMRFPNITRDARPPIAVANAQWIERPIYKGTLLNQPHKLTETRKDDTVLFVHTPGTPHPMQVRQAYFDERPRWAFAPCDKCGADQGMDPPTVMAKTRFPDAPPGAVPLAFTALCPCGGAMMLAVVEGAPPPARSSAGAPASADAEKKPWWKFW